MRGAAAFAILLTLGGCVSAINIKNAERHAQAGNAALQRGDWDTARRQFAQAVVNADLGSADLGGKVIVNYEYGRALGVTCFWEESEKYLLRSKHFEEQRGRAPYLQLYELGLLTEKQGKLTQAALYFEQLIPLMEKAGLRSQFPLGVADAYERYANSLQATGRTTESISNRSEANSIRAANPTRKFEE